MHRTLFRIVALMVLGLIATTALQARGKKPPKNKKPAFDYYMLVLSYAPDFCAQPAGDKDPRECGDGRQVGFVVHGLWPQGETARGPENCGSAVVSPTHPPPCFNVPSWLLAKANCWPKFLYFCTVPPNRHARWAEPPHAGKDSALNLKTNHQSTG